MAARLEHIGPSPQHLLRRVTGDFNQGAVDMHNHAIAVAYQHSLTGTVKHHCRLAQTLLILTLAFRVHALAEKTGQAAKDKKNQDRGYKRPNVGIYELPMG